MRPAGSGPAHPARHRRAGRQGRESRRREDPGQAQPVHPAVICTRSVNRTRLGATVDRSDDRVWRTTTLPAS